MRTTRRWDDHQRVDAQPTERGYVMAPLVDQQTSDGFTALALGQGDVLEQFAELRELFKQESHLDDRSFALVKIAALVALDAAPASYLWQVAQALDAGVTPREILGTLLAIAPQVGAPRVVAAAPEIMLALDLELPSEDI